MSYARRKDNNQSGMESELAKLGFTVLDTSRFGHGFPDMIVVGYSRRTNQVHNLLVEVKNGRGKLTIDEEIWHREYPDDGPCIVARSLDDVLNWFGAI